MRARSRARARASVSAGVRVKVGLAPGSCHARTHHALHTTHDHTPRAAHHAQVNGRPVGGVIHQPFVDLPPTYADVGSKQVLGGVSHHPPQGAAATTVTVSRSHTGGAVDMVSTLFAGHTSLPAGGAGYKALLVLQGSADAYLHVTKSKVRWVRSPQVGLPLPQDSRANHPILHPLAHPAITPIPPS